LREGSSRCRLRASTFIPRRLIAGALALACWAVPVSAQWKGWDYELDEEKKDWKEIEAALPPYPKPENLIPFEGSSASSHRYFIDAPSLSIGKDGVVRYTLVIRTAGGAMNVSFEGIRCDMRQHRTYAFGHPGDKWSRARDAEWHRIDSSREQVRHQAVLHTDFFCSGKKPLKNSAEILQLLKHQPERVRGGMGF
jgi:hypothetical protein